MSCLDCARPYGDEHGFPDLLVPGGVWALLVPERPGGGGLLCPSCICGRAARLGLRDVPCRFTSGPFADHSPLPFETAPP